MLEKHYRFHGKWNRAQLNKVYYDRIPYKRAWLLIDMLNKGIGKPVVITSTGGKDGDSVLIPLGQNLLSWYDKTEANLNKQSQQDLQDLEKILFGES